MNQCLRCKAPCESTVNFCDDCRAFLQSRFQHNDQAAHSIPPHHADKETAAALKSNDLESIPTTPHASIEEPTSIPHNEDDLTELATMPISEAMNDLPAEDADVEQDKGNERIEQSDPLLTRHLPNSAEATLIEEEDIQRAAVQGNVDTIDTKPVPSSKRWRNWGQHIPYLGAMPGQMRIALMAFVSVAALALILEGALIFLDLTHHLPNIIVSETASKLAQKPGTGQTKVSTSPVTTGGQPSSSGSPVPGTTPPGLSQTPLPSSPMQSISPLGFQFTATQGQSNPPRQQLSIGNTSNGPFYWQASTNSSSSTWLSVTPVDGAVPAGQSISALVNVNAAGLTSGTYNGQITVTATDASGMQVQGSPQTALVTLSVLQPCTLKEAPTSLSFTVSFLQPNAPGQNISFKEIGNCARPVSWTASVDAGSQNWLTLSATSGSDHGNGNTIVVNVNAQGEPLGRHTGRITLEATDSNGGPIQNSPQYIAVTLNVIA